MLKQLPRTVCNQEDGRQLIRSSGSVGANFAEANDSLSHKDLVLRARIARRERKESRYWLRLLEVVDESLSRERESLVEESTELKKILSAIIRKQRVILFGHFFFRIWTFFGLCFLGFGISLPIHRWFKPSRKDLRCPIR